jgi:threonine dehydratase
MGQRGAIYGRGSPHARIFDPQAAISGTFCRQTATFDRKDRQISDLTENRSVTRQDVVDAAERIAGLAERTPLLAAEIRGEKVWLKCECLQVGGSFKLRGATNRLLQLTQAERKVGVVAYSSGNHAQGVAIAASRLGIPATIVMPADAPKVKVDGTRAQGAEIVFYDRSTESREEIAAAIAAERGAPVVPSFADERIIAGQGSVGIEITEQLEEAGVGSPRQIVVPCGGGGLTSGIALACPGAEIVGVEPAGWDDMKRSLEQGEIVSVEPGAPPTLCDALQTIRVSPLTFGVLRDRAARMVAVDERAVREAIRFAWLTHQLTVEPGGAVALAAAMSGLVELDEGTVVVLSGGNIDPALHARIVESED